MARGKAQSSTGLINETLLNFLHKKINSFIKWDLIRFFHDNPHTRDTAENIARYTLRDSKTIERELEGLVKGQVITVEEIAGFRIYALTDDPDVRKVINDFMEACHDRQFRVEAINRVIQEMQFTPRHDF
ncbi:MAG: hypothetical protein OHK0046_30210 [Anaerolineae bacterium]